MPRSRFRDATLAAALATGMGCQPGEDFNFKNKDRMEQRDQSLDGLVKTHEDWLRVVRRFSFYGNYKGYQEMADYLEDHPGLEAGEEAFRKQVEAAGGEKQFLPELTTGDRDYDAWLRDEAAKQDLAWVTDYLTAWMIAETFDGQRLNPQAGSTAGAVGLFQFKEETAQEVGVTDREDPEQNIRGGVRLVALVKERYPELTTHWELVLASGKGVGGFKEQVLEPAKKHGRCQHPSPVQMLEVLKGQEEAGPREARRHILKMALLLDMIDLEDVAKYENFGRDEQKLRAFIRQYGVTARNKFRRPPEK